MTLVYLTLVAAIAAIQTTGQKPLKPTVVDVRIVVAPRTSLEEQCKAGKYAPVDVLVDDDLTVNEPYHCYGRGFSVMRKLTRKRQRLSKSAT